MTAVLGRYPDKQGALPHRNRQRPAGSDDLAVNLTWQLDVGLDLHGAGLVPLQERIVMAAARNDPQADLNPAERSGRREDDNIQQPVIEARIGHDRESARQRT